MLQVAIIELLFSIFAFIYCGDLKAIPVPLTEAEFDIVYAYATHHYLLNNFQRTDINDRNDEYGGSVKNRSRLLCEIIEVLKDAVGDKIEVHIDGGIRTGQDVLKCMAMGAKGTYIGRAYTYGLGALGEQGVTKTLEILQKEMDFTMALCGEKNILNVSKKNLLIPKDFIPEWL